MNIESSIPLSSLSTMGLGGPAQYFVAVTTEDELVEALTWAEQRQQKILVLGGGSNVVFTDEGFRGLVIQNRITGFEVLDEAEDSTTIRIGAGENWDDVVRGTVERNLSGIEALSMIPGTAGATPVQNVGAYGQEIADTLVELRAYDRESKDFVTLDNATCRFEYRNSIFKSSQRGRFIITSITLKLRKAMPRPPFYDSLQAYFNEHGITEFTPQVVRDAVMAIRSVKLPDPSVVRNNGSFFKNPVISSAQFAELQAKYPDVKGFPAAGGAVKVPAGWLVEQAGFKNFRHENGMGTYENHALVLVNYSASSYHHLVELVKQIQYKVQELFNIELQPEPETIAP